MKNKNIIFSLILFTLLGSLACFVESGCSKAPKNENIPLPAQKSEKFGPQDSQNRAEPLSGSAVSAMIFKGPGEILPQTIDSFSISSAPRYFGPDNLFDLINGGAEIYVEFGLRQMVTADFKSGSHPGVTITVEVYDQGSALGAFGRMARFLSEKIDPSEAGQGLPEKLKDRGLFGATDLVFFKDRYLVHVTLIDESADATLESMSKTGKAILPLFAEKLAAEIESDPPLPEVLGLFPPEHRIARSEAWVTQGLAGVSDLGPGFSFRYNEGDINWVLFVTDELKDQRSSETKAKQLFDSSSDKKLFAFEPAGNRIVGFAASAQAWTEKSRETAMRQVESLTKAILEKL